MAIPLLHRRPPPLFLSPSQPVNPFYLPRRPPQSLSLYPRPNVSLPLTSLSLPTSNLEFQSPPINPHSEPNLESPFEKFLRLLPLCGRYGDPDLARAVHASVLKFEEDTHLANALILAYLDLGFLPEAYRVFSCLSSPDVFSFTAIISAFAKDDGYRDEAVQLFSRMRVLGVDPNGFTFVAVITACSRILDMELGVQLHSLAVKLGYICNTYVANALMGLYGKCGGLEDAVQLFDEMPQRDMASWNTIMSCFLNEKMYDSVFQLLHEMQEIDGFRVDRVTILTLLNACALSCARKAGRELHTHALKMGFESNLSVSNALIGFYTKCGSVSHVQALFERMAAKDVLTWTGMITAFMEFGRVDLALEMFKLMPDRNSVTYNAVLSGLCQNDEALLTLRMFYRMVKMGLELTDVSLTNILHACSLLGERKLSEQIHGFVLKFGFGSNACIQAALLDMCTRCGRMMDAKKLFSQRHTRQDICLHWTPMICAYARNGQPEEAILLFQQGQLEETIFLDEVLTTSMIGICGTLGFLELGQQFHCHAIKTRFLSELRVGNALLSMYCECGHVEAALRIFDMLPVRDVVSWNGLIAGHLLHRQGGAALAVWSELKDSPVKSDWITFLLVISSYKHTRLNLVDECRSLFLSMKSTYNVQPTTEHYAAFVSVLGFWGLLKEAEDTIAEMPFEAEASVWRALLDGCTIHLNKEIGNRAMKQILAIEPNDPSTFILQSNLYSASGIWHRSEMKREEMQRRGFSKIPGRSWVIHQNKVQSFYARDRSHLQSKDTDRGLKILILECMKVGYVPDTSFVLHEVEENQKKDFLFYHSAKLAVTYGILTNRTRKTIRVSKNIRLCGDCHNFLKHVSVVTKRDICLRDTTGFHYFSGGQCTCKDRW